MGHRGKIGEILFRQLSCKILAFTCKYHVKLENFVNSSGKYHPKFGHFARP